MPHVFYGIPGLRWAFFHIQVFLLCQQLLTLKIFETQLSQ